MAEIINEKDLEQVSGGAGALYSGPVFRYTIQKGDCLSVLAQKYHTTVAVIMSLNPYVTNPDKIYAGKTLLIPYIKK